MKLLLPAFFAILLLGCAKSEVIDNTETVKLGCQNSTKATVKKLILNEAGTDFFYYLAVENNIGGSNDVFPSTLSLYLQEEGKRLIIQYTPTADQHRYIICRADHNYDPANPDEKAMPLIDVCSATPSL